MLFDNPAYADDRIVLDYKHGRRYRRWGADIIDMLSSAGNSIYKSICMYRHIRKQGPNRGGHELRELKSYL